MKYQTATFLVLGLVCFGPTLLDSAVHGSTCHDDPDHEVIASTATTRQPKAASESGPPEDSASYGDNGEERFLTLEFDLDAVSELEISGSVANFDLTATEATVELPWLSISAGLFDFDWENAEALDFTHGASQPWEQLTTVELRKTWLRPLNDRLIWMTSLGAGLSFEEETSDSHFADVLVAAVWNRSANWSFLFGAGYSWHSTIDVEFELFPALGFTYRPQAEEGFSASFGIPQTEMRYRFSPRSAMSLGADAQTFVSRLADDSAIAAAGYVEFLRFGLGLYYEHRVADRFELQVGPTYGFEGELKIHDSQGILLSTHDLEPTAGLSLKMSVAF